MIFPGFPGVLYLSGFSRFSSKCGNPAVQMRYQVHFANVYGWSVPQWVWWNKYPAQFNKTNCLRFRVMATVTNTGSPKECKQHWQYHIRSVT